MAADEGLRHDIGQTDTFLLVRLKHCEHQQTNTRGIAMLHQQFGVVEALFVKADIGFLVA